MKTSARFWTNSLLITVLIGMNWVARNFPQFIDAFYTNGFYPLRYQLHALFFGQFSISLGDLLYLTVVFLFIFCLFGWKKTTLKQLGQFMTIVLLLLLHFQLSWGLNYHKTPLVASARAIKNYTEDELNSITHFFARESNRLHFQLSTNDSLAVKINGNKQNIIKRVEGFSQEHPIKGKIKLSLFSLPLTYMGFSGYLNPFTLEAQVNRWVPKIDLPVTAAHEMAHQQGYAAENEANFIGFLRCYYHPDLDIQYAARLFGLRYTYRELYSLNPDKAEEIRCSLYPGILENFAESSRFWKAHTNPLEPLLKQSYDSYLKANNQKEGIQSYNAVVNLFITHFNIAENPPTFEN